MSYSLNPLKGVLWGIIHGSVIGLIKGDTRSLDYGSYGDGLYGDAKMFVTTFFANRRTVTFLGSFFEP